MVLADPPSDTVDLATTSTDTPFLKRVHGSTGTGVSGVPVAGGLDADGDGLADLVLAAMRASPAGRTEAGEVFLVFGDGTVTGTVDTGVPQSGVLRVWGAAANENTGNEVWMADVTGDGVGDLIVCRQNFTPGLRTGAGALTLLVGGTALRTQAKTLSPLDLANPPAAVTRATLWGAASRERLCIWARTGDVTGDGIDDIAVGADQHGPAHNGAVYLIRGGAHLIAAGTVDLAGFGQAQFPLEGHVLRLDPPGPSDHYHFGATVAIADLDADGRGEVLVAAALNRAGAGLPPAGDGFAHAVGGSPRGSVFIVWDEALADPWPPGHAITAGATPSTSTTLDGGAANRSFGEELVGGADHDGDGTSDLFVGDLTGTSPNGGSSGLGYVFYDAASLKGLTSDVDNLPPGLRTTTLYGPEPGAIAADTAALGDFDGDGHADLALSSPHASPLSRPSAGTFHVLFGRPGGWPVVVDLRPGQLPPESEVRVAEIYGARGTEGGDLGDTLAYSAAAGDVDGNGCTDLLFNEMLGNGTTPGSVDAGNLVVLGCRRFGCLLRDGFESGTTERWSSTEP